MAGNPFRAKWGWAWGPIWTTTGQTSDFRTPVFAESNSRPDVTVGTMFYTNNTTTTTITEFNLNTTVVNGNEYEGKVITVLFLDGSTRLANAGNLKLSTSDGLQGANNMIRLLYHNSSWIEISRSYNNSSILNVTSIGIGGVGSVDVRGNVKVLNLLSYTGSPLVLRTAVTGEEGQMLTLLSSNSESVVIVNSAANDTFVLTSSGSPTQFRIASSGATSFVKFQTRWMEIRPAGMNSSNQI